MDPDCGLFGLFLHVCCQQYACLPGQAGAAFSIKKACMMELLTFPLNAATVWIPLPIQSQTNLIQHRCAVYISALSFRVNAGGYSCAMATEMHQRFVVSSAGACPRRFDNEHVPSDIAANGPGERRDTSPPLPLNLAVSNPAPVEQPRKTLLRNTLRNSPARLGYNDRRAELRGHLTPTRRDSLSARANHLHASPVHVALRARDTLPPDQDVPAFTPLPPRLCIPDHRISYPVSSGQLCRPDAEPSPLSPGLGVSPSPTRSPVFRARHRHSPTRGAVAVNHRSSDHYHLSPQSDSRIEAWLENVRPNHAVDEFTTSLGSLQFQRRRDGVIEPKDRHSRPQRSFRFDHPARAPAAFLTTGSYEDLHHLPSSQTCNANNFTGRAINSPPFRLPEDPYRYHSHFAPQTTTPSRHPLSLFHGSQPHSPPPSGIPAPQTLSPLSSPHISPTHSPRCPGTASSPTRPPHHHHGSYGPVHPPLAPEPATSPQCSHTSTSPLTTGAPVAKCCSSLSVSPPPPPPQPCITLSPPPLLHQPLQPPPRLVHPCLPPPPPPPPHSPATPVRRRPRQRGPAPLPPADWVLDAEEEVPVTPRASARESRFGGGAGAGAGDRREDALLSPDVYLWRGDSERREKYREVVRNRRPSFLDEDILGGWERHDEVARGM
ncbi:hypothetical protein B0J12DRAFT_697009 [Macrophomina phaseolina]|uniref:Uncharacterized protein n=1 Tax=Macrophomina phaseolina TaxID=35725 RepID=A0ABQ8GIQ3_9PEZI|nr:hypothetical protein B0J12DRAFT_697009 [Macrophomina phaseolina]